MTRILKTIVPALALALAAVPAFAQGSTQSPPSPNAASSSPAAATSAPPGAMTTNPGTTQNPNVSGALNGNGTSAGSAGSASSTMARTVPAPATK